MNATAQRAAAKIVELINTRPRTPTQQDIAAVLAKELAAATEPSHLSQRALADLARWDEAMREYLGAYYEDENAEISISEEQLEAELEQFSAVCRELWARPVRDWSDLVVLAAIAVYWNADSDDSEPYPDGVLNEDDDPAIGADQNSLGFVVRGICELAGLHFDVRGRLLTSLKSQASPADEPLPQLAIDIRDKIGELRAAYDRLGPIDDAHAFRVVEAEIKALIGELNALDAQIPNPPRSFADVTMRAEIALYWTAEETVDALKASQASKGQDEVRMGRLIEAVLQLAGARR
jgi:hypothetical protein